MMRGGAKFRWVALGAAMVAATPRSAWACAVCFGNAEAPMTQGVSWGIVTLLFILASVLGGIVAAGLFVVRRAASVPPEALELEQARVYGEASVVEKEPEPTRETAAMEPVGK